MGSRSLRCTETTLRNERRDFPEWHRGRTHYALWALRLDSAELAARMRNAQAHLAPWLLDGYQRQPHITLGLCGFLSAAPTQDDDFGAATLQAQLQALHRLRPAPLAIAIGGLDSFTSVPYLRVQAEPAGLQALRQCLAGNAAINSAPARYTPHVTVGLYAGAWPMATLQEAFGRFPHSQDLPLQVSGIELLCYAAREIGGLLLRLADYDFATGSLRWDAAAHALTQPLRSLA